MGDSIRVRVKLTEGAQMPQYETAGAAGVDLRTIEDVSLGPMERGLAPTGVWCEIPLGYEGQVRMRSGLAIKQGLALVNSPGTIDADYRGEIKVILINLGSETIHLKKGERIAQLVFCPIARATMEQVQELSESNRGGGGFGSTGQ